MEYMLIDVNERNNSPRNITIQFKAFDSVGLMFPDSVLYDVTTEYDVCALFDIPYVGVVLIDKIMSVLVNQKTCIHLLTQLFSARKHPFAMEIQLGYLKTSKLR